jgi:hypothetical protein
MSLQSIERASRTAARLGEIPSMSSALTFVRANGARAKGEDPTKRDQGAILVAGSLQPLWPELVMAATLNQ